jgi:poly-gamma-glutamate synthase PgsB/CapB
MNPRSVIQDVIDDLASRQALSGAASVLYIALFIGGWWWWVRRVHIRRRDVETAVLVTGSRGKSSTVRALHAALSAAGMATYAKTTGTAAAEIDVNGRETSTRRIGQVTVLEVLRIMQKALSNGDKPNALVFECMAVRPNLIAVLANDMLKPNITIITNAQVDHLEDEGSSLEEIARAMSEAITPGSFVITGERDAAPLSAIREVAQSRGALLVESVPEHLPPNASIRLPYVHPQNITSVLNITRFLGINDEIAIDGMARASKEPGEFEVWRRSVGDIDVTYADFGAINDPHSMLSALRGFDWPLARSNPRIALLTGRWDRPYRDLSFIGCIERQSFDGVIVAGGPVRMVCGELVRSGWPVERIMTSKNSDVWEPWRNRRLEDLIRRIDASASAAMLVALQNEHEVLADRFRSFFHQGALVRDRVNGDQ